MNNSNSEKEFRQFMVSFIKDFIVQFNNLSEDIIDTIPTEFLRRLAEAFSIALLSQNKVDNSQN